MHPKGLLVAVVLLAALGGLVWWSNKKEASASKGDTSTKILSIPDDQFQEIRIKKLTGETIALSRTTGKWRILEPQALPADQDAVSGMVSSLSTLNADKVVEEKATDLQPFGLHMPTLDVQIKRKDGKTDAILIGDDTPTGSGAYVKLPSDAKVYTMASYTKTSLDKRVDDLRDKRLMTFDQDKLSRVELQAKGQTIEFGKNAANEWQIVKPKPIRADGSQVDALIRSLREAKLDPPSAEDQKKNVAEFSAGTPFATAKVTAAAGTQELQVRKNKDDYYAKSSILEGDFKIPSGIAEGLSKSLDDFRNKKLFDFGFLDPDKVEIHDGAKAYYLTKGSSDWWGADGKKLDADSAQSVVDKLRDLSSVKFPDSDFAAPTIEITVVSRGNKVTEKVSIAKSGVNYIAKREREASLYELGAVAVEEIRF